MTASFDAGCCHNMKVVFFKPKMPEGQDNSFYGDFEGQYNSNTTSSYGDSAIPGIEAGFYMDLSARAINAVESMKK